jgi:hypothetical protein
MGTEDGIRSCCVVSVEGFSGVKFETGSCGVSSGVASKGGSFDVEAEEESCGVDAGRVSPDDEAGKG